MRKMFVEKSLMEDETFLYGIQIPGYMLMCSTDVKTVTTPFENPLEISKKDLSNFDNLYIVEKNSPLLKRMVKMEKYDMIIGVVVDKELETSRDIITALEEIIDYLEYCDTGATSHEEFDL